MSQLHPQDLGLLRRIFAPVAVKCGTGFGGHNYHRFHFINNPDGTIRWLVPATCRRPVFLKLYNGSGWRGWLFRSYFRVGYALGLRRLAVSGSVDVHGQKDELFDGLLSRFPSSEYAIFTGTVGENRKAVFALTDGQNKDWFFKLPLTGKSEKLVEREAAVLHELGALSFEKMEVPSAEKYGTGVLVSSVRPSRPGNSFRLQNAHYEALAELSGQTKLYLPLASLSVWKEIGKNLKTLETLEIKNNLPEAKIKKLCRGLIQIYSSFEAGAKWPTSISHGDFTPWNMYVSDKKLHVYDWELSARQPLLYDAFHFVFQSGILIERASFDTIWERAQALKSEKTVRQILGNDGALFEQFFRFYLLRNVSYYLVRYVCQNPLHGQAHWLVDVWEKAVEVVVGKLSPKVNVPENRLGVSNRVFLERDPK